MTAVLTASRHSHRSFSRAKGLLFSQM